MANFNVASPGSSSTPAILSLSQDKQTRRRHRGSSPDDPVLCTTAAWVLLSSSTSALGPTQKHAASQLSFGNRCHTGSIAESNRSVLSGDRFQRNRLAFSGRSHCHSPRQQARSPKPLRPTSMAKKFWTVLGRCTL